MIAKPDGSGPYRDGEPVTFEASVTDVEDAEDTLFVAWSEGGVPLSIDDTADDYGVLTSTASFAAGTHVVTLTVTDADGASSSDTVHVTVSATPTVSVSIAPSSPVTGDDLVATATGTDAEGDALSYTWLWSQDGAATSLTSDTVPAADTDRGETWTVWVQVSNGYSTKIGRAHV